MSNNIGPLYCSESLRYSFSNQETINPPVQQTSRVKRKLLFGDPEAQTKIQKVVHRSIQSPQKKNLSDLYGIDLEKPSFGQSESEFFILRDEIQAIENKIYKVDVEKKTLVRKYVQFVLNSNLAFEHKLSELGVFYYKIEQKEKFFLNQWLVKSLIDEIILELRKREWGYRNILPGVQKKIPSGKVQYLFEIIAQLIITSEGKFHKAGAQAALFLLKDFNIVRQWSEEHLLHLETVIQKLLCSTEFASSLNKTLTLHPEMETCVRLDLKLPASHKVTDAEAKRASLIALFFDLRQRDEPNCYAVSTLQFLILNHPEIVFKKILLFFEEGSFTFDFSHKIPLFSLIKDRLVLEKKMDIKIPENKAADLSVVQTVIQGMEISNGQSSPETSDQVTLSEYVKKKAPNTPKKRILQYGKKLFTAFHQNSLQKLLLAEIEFYQANKLIKISDLKLFQKNLRNSAHNETSEKSSIIKAVMEIVKDTVLQENRFFLSEIQTFFEFLQMQLNDWLWLSLSPEHNIKTSEESLWLNDIEVITVNKKDKKKLSAFEILFQNSVYLLAILPTENKYIFTFEDLKELIIKAANESYNNAFSANDKVLKLINKLKEKFHSQHFQREFSKFLAKYNNEISSGEQNELTWKDFFELKRMAFYHGGGLANEALSLYNVKTKKVKLLNTSNINQFIELLYNSIKELQKNSQSPLSPSTFFLCSSPDHLFTFAPSRISDFWNDTYKSAWEVVQENILKPAQKILAAPLSKNKIIKILKEIHTESKFNEIIKKLVDPISAADFLKYMHKREYNKYELETLNKNFEKVLMEISPTEIPLVNLLKILKIQAEPSIVAHIEKEMQSYASDGIELREAACILRGQFLIHSLKIISSQEIEKCLAGLMGLPTSFDMGDLNYADCDASNEVPYHERLILRYDFVDQKLNFFKRSKWDEEKNFISEKEILEEFTLSMAY